MTKTLITAALALITVWTVFTMAQTIYWNGQIKLITEQTLDQSQFR